MKKEDAKALVDFIAATADVHMELIRYAYEAGYVNSTEMIDSIYENHPELLPITSFLRQLTVIIHDDEEMEHDGGVIVLLDFRTKEMKAKMEKWLNEEFRDDNPYEGLEN